MRIKVQPALPEDAESIAALRNAVSDDLTFRHGRGSWTAHCTTAEILFDLRQGIGRAFLEQSILIARSHGADALFLDAYDHPAAGAGSFYAACGWRETGRSVYWEIPLIYYDRRV